MDRYTRDSPILNKTPTVDIGRITKSFRTPNYTKAETTVIIASYIANGQLCGVDPVLAVAQMIHETGRLTSFWSAKPQCNPAGIGVTSRHSTTPRPGFAYNPQRHRWEQGVTFGTWDAAITAHLGRLLCYATFGPFTPTQQKFVNASEKARKLPASRWGRAPNLAGLEKTWATPGVGYADKIAETANSLLR